MNQRKFSMSIPRSASFFGCVLMVTSPLACKSTTPEEQKKAGESTPSETSATGSGSATESSKTDASQQALPPAQARLSSQPLAHEPGIVLGHVVLANGSQLLSDLKNNIVTSTYKGFLEESTLRSLASMQLEEYSQVAQNIDISQPFGCAVVDFKIYEVPVSCLFAYKGGAGQLVNDLGATHKKADAAGHTAVYTVENKDVYIDALDNFVVVTSHPELFAKTNTYLKSNIIDRKEKIYGAIELVAYPVDISKTYQKDIDELFAKFSSLSKSPPKTDHPQLNEVVELWTSYQQQSTHKLVDQLGSYAQFTGYLGLDKRGMWFGFSMIPTPDSHVAKEAQMFGGRKVNPALASTAPQGTIMLVAGSADPRASTSESSKELRKLLTDSWAKLTKKDPADTAKTFDAYIQEAQELYEGQSIGALVYEPGAPAAFVFATQLKSGKSARDSWKTFAQTFTPEAVLGPEFSQFVMWSFKSDVYQADGVPVDRWTIEPTPLLRKEIAAKMDAKEQEMVKKYLGELQLNIDRAELNERVLFTVAPKAEEPFMKRSLAAQKGQGSLAGNKGLESVLASDPNASTVFALDLKQGLEWLKSFEPLREDLNKLPGPLGQDLSDISVSMALSTDGVTRVEYLLSQPLINQLRTLAEHAD